MTQTLIATPALSPGFERARKLSRVMAVLFSIGFWFSLLGILFIIATPFVPLRPHGDTSVMSFGDITVSIGGLSFAQRAWVSMAMLMPALPLVLLMHHTRRVFGYFARGEIFILPVIGHIRHAGMWLIVSFFANIAGQTALRLTGLIPKEQTHGTAWPLVIGIVTFIAAHVMAEASRIAADHAEIV